ncbi:hypothetical protein NECAME_19249 [Necator americanus]|uniref:Uncharacterized protein n=1 Tax=Necator americanus TaxID=51031 RepID=W2SPS7_NECAM|nr:hypothetical protein NECAME_19249 [Necator americanus]ETN71650.1 hypothetical protein NECAME_19249 [Necator americanus]
MKALIEIAIMSSTKLTEKYEDVCQCRSTKRCFHVKSRALLRLNGNQYEEMQHTETEMHKEHQCEYVNK